MDTIARLRQKQKDKLVSTLREQVEKIEQVIDVVENDPGMRSILVYSTLGPVVETIALANLDYIMAAGRIQELALEVDDLDTD